MPDLVVGATVPTFKAVSGEATQWLSTAEFMIEDAKVAGFDAVHFFVAVEHDGRGIAPFAALFSRIGEINKMEGATGSYWTFSICDHSSKIDGFNRLVRICTGRNLIHEFALRGGDVSHVLFLDSDLIVPDDSISKLREMDYPMVGGDVPSYCLSGPRVKSYPFKVEEHWNTAGFLMVTRQIVQRIRWRSDLHPGGTSCSDDPCFANDVEEIFGLKTHVRKDLIGAHKPLVPLERRGHDLNLVGQVH